MNQLRTEMHKVTYYCLLLFKKYLRVNWNKKKYLKSKEFSSANEKSIENEMISIKHRYLEIQEQLSLAEKVTF